MPRAYRRMPASAAATFRCDTASPADEQGATSPVLRACTAPATHTLIGAGAAPHGVAYLCSSCAMSIRLKPGDQVVHGLYEPYFYEARSPDGVRASPLPASALVVRTGPSEAS